ncbi:MAG: SUMF1/EgtB/PvdO family nonheme iron enzyme [Chloroflexaceae bacterium]
MSHAKSALSVRYWATGSNGLAARNPLLRERNRPNNVLRGGSWNNDQSNARCAYRNHNNPDNHNDNIGLRLATRAACPPEMRCAVTCTPQRRGIQGER